MPGKNGSSFIASPELIFSPLLLSRTKPGRCVCLIIQLAAGLMLMNVGDPVNSWSGLPEWSR